MKMIFENEKYTWYTTDQTVLASEYMKTKGLQDHFVALVEMKDDKRQEYVLLRADETAKSEAVFASSAIGEIVNQIDALTNLSSSIEGK
jgi:hypothetical protein